MSVSQGIFAAKELYSSTSNVVLNYHNNIGGLVLTKVSRNFLVNKTALDLLLCYNVSSVINHYPSSLRQFEQNQFGIEAITQP